MEEIVTGTFYLMMTPSKNLLGEFNNDTIPGPRTESADLLHAMEHPFEGNYLSTWREEEGPMLSQLQIRRMSNEDAGNRMYILTWNIANKEAFKGKATLGEDNVLRGSYTLL